MNSNDPIVIVGAARTPMGGLQGSLASLTAPNLGAAAIAAAIERAGLSGNDIDEVIMGCVLPAGQGQAPARQAALQANIPMSTGATTINKMCGSGMKALMFAHDAILAESCQIIVAGGMESMSQAPHLLPQGRSGIRFGHGQILDHMAIDGLEDAYDRGKAMGCYAEDTATEFRFSRQMQDDFAIASLKRAQLAIENGSFSAEITPLTIKTRKGEHLVNEDEQPGKARFDKIPKLRPAFAKSGTVTAANSSSISDGAAALVLMRRSQAQHRQLKILATIKAHASHAHEPSRFTTAPISAIKKLLNKVDWHSEQVDLFEINEAFAVVTLAVMQELRLDHSKVNVHGGACALGHPIGASGARIIVTLLATLQKYDKSKGVAALCIGGGEATAVAIEIEP